MKITLAQINTTPNDFAGNFRKIQNGIEKALEDKADVVVFPELTIPGYLVKDLVYTTGFIEKNLEYLNQVTKLTIDSTLTVILGYIDRNTTGIGKPFKNMAAVIRNGVVIATYQKHLLPFYDIFDEARYFAPGKDICVFEVAGKRCGAVICEDSWNDKGQDDYNYDDNPIESYRKVGVEYVFSLNSSPYVKGKPGLRKYMLERVSNNFTMVYVNQIGGQDEVVFDGHSCIIRNGQTFVYMKTPIIPNGDGDLYETHEMLDKTGGAPYLTTDDETDHLRMTLMGLRDYIVKSGFKSVVLGSSGGVDSALVSTLATLAIGKENVNCIMMPSCYSSEGSVNDAKELHKRLGCKEFLVPIEHLNLTKHINKCFGFIEYGEDYDPMASPATIIQKVDYNKVADENIQARMRGQIVMHYSNATGALPLTTGNKTELAVGYCTLYGDMNGGFNPIGDLYKMEVFAMCEQINKLFGKLIPEEILKKKPSAELKPGQTDEASLLPYPILDEIVELYVERYITRFDDYKNILQNKNKHDPATFKDYERIARLIYINEFKRRQAAPTIKLRRVAFGTGRRLPIVKK